MRLTPVIFLSLQMLACAPDETPDPKAVAQEVRAGGIQCVAEFEDAVRDAVWIDAFYVKHKTAIDDLVARAVTEATGLYGLSIGNDSLAFSTEWPEQSIKIHFEGHSFEVAAEIREAISPFLSANLDNRYDVRTPPRYYIRSDEWPTWIKGDFFCTAPDREFIREISWGINKTPIAYSYSFRQGSNEFTLNARAVLSKESYDDHALFFSGLACEDARCIGLARFNETGYEHDQVVSGIEVPVAVPSFLKAVFPRFPRP